ncbi:Proton myo-inositol cotransporter [Toxocara canis]|uniref:Proton myo-inositol cotransporter n=1 Tax=Toxocara canis TaxID=6265 RepID=A0A0B2VT19_TOXCA|nr:Proton myo-inositol cotransporter [Toxocara canis]
MLYIVDYDGMKPMTSIWKELIISITPGMAIIGALGSSPFADRWGRRPVIIASAVLFAIGGVVCGAATEKICLLVGRILLGIAIGIASMIIPIYIGEAAPSYIRGSLITTFQVMIAFGQVIANFVAGVFSYANPVYTGWRFMLGLASVPGIIQLIGFFFLPESPRFLFYKNRKDEAEKACRISEAVTKEVMKFSVGLAHCPLAPAAHTELQPVSRHFDFIRESSRQQVLERVYSGSKEWIAYEMSEIKDAYEEEMKAKAKVGDSPVLWRMITTPHVLKALMIGCAIQLFQQLSGVNTIMYYTGQIIQSAGVKDKHLTIWISLGISTANVLGTLIPLTLVERFGRRVLLLISVGMTFVTLVLMGVAFLLINKDSPDAIPLTVINGTHHYLKNCIEMSNCDLCVTNDHCGFCHIGTEKDPGYCLPLNLEDTTDVSALGPCSYGYNTSAFTFVHSFCVTRYTVMPIILMVVYLGFFSMGFAPLTWVLNAEFYPLWARGVGCSLSTSFNWIGDLIIALTFLTLSQAVTKYGAFFIYAGFTLIAFVFIFFLVPETKGLPIEEVELLFMPKKSRRRTRSVLRAQEALKLRNIKKDTVAPMSTISTVS